MVGNPRQRVHHSCFSEPSGAGLVATSPALAELNVLSVFSDVTTLDAIAFLDASLAFAGVIVEWITRPDAALHPLRFRHGAQRRERQF